eukprot:TRINITY_DN8722_c0_g1_i1.p1 TRINITY_DN8722_c0_g1~~TRINITY_DN8722_c0_g1_i1.p1  ORF type:complete len:663 (-),score=87.14 TRINITY_DN8722_c0_g1_i1:686-2527(-)
MEEDEEQEKHIRQALRRPDIEVAIPTPQVTVTSQPPEPAPAAANAGPTAASSADKSPFQRGANYIRCKGLIVRCKPFDPAEDPSVVEYDADSEDDQWLQQYNSTPEGKKSPVAIDKLEVIFDRLEKEMYRLGAADDGPPIPLPKSDRTLREVRPALLQAVYTYWTNKRQRIRHNLLRRLERPPSMDNKSPLVAFRPIGVETKTTPVIANDRQSFTQLLAIRQGLDRVRSIADLIKQRESLKKDVIQATISICVQQIACGADAPEVFDFAHAKRPPVSTPAPSHPARASAPTSSHSRVQKITPRAPTLHSAPTSGPILKSVLRRSGYEIVRLETAELPSAPPVQDFKEPLPKRPRLILNGAQLVLPPAPQAPVAPPAGVSAPAPIPSARATQAGSVPATVQPDDTTDVFFPETDIFDFRSFFSNFVPAVPAPDSTPFPRPIVNPAKDALHYFDLDVVEGSKLQKRRIFARPRLGRGGRLVFDRVSRREEKAWRSGTSWPTPIEWQDGIIPRSTPTEKILLAQNEAPGYWTSSDADSSGVDTDSDLDSELPAVSSNPVRDRTLTLETLLAEQKRRRYARRRRRLFRSRVPGREIAPTAAVLRRLEQVDERPIHRT